MSEDQPPSPQGAQRRGSKFVNQVTTAHASGGNGLSALKWLATRKPGRWDDWRPLVGTVPAPAERVHGDDLQVTFINHATVLLQTQGLNLLTDPVWSKRCSPAQWAGPKRHRPPGLPIEALPPVDAVLLSHDHYDHLDATALRWIATRDKPVIVAGLGMRALLERLKIHGGVDLDWWQSTTLNGVQIHAVPARHFSGRGIHDRDKRLWIGHTVVTPAGHITFCGDTGWGPHFAQIRERFGPARLALIPIGAFKPEWFMSSVHIDPPQAVQAHRVLEAQTSVAIHFGTFPLADDAQDEPVELLQKALTDAGEDHDAFWVMEHGEARAVPR